MTEHRIRRMVGDTTPIVLDLTYRGAPFAIAGGSLIYVTMVGKGGAVDGQTKISAGACGFTIGENELTYQPLAGEVDTAGRYVLEVFGTLPDRTLRVRDLVEVVIEPNIRTLP